MWPKIQIDVGINSKVGSTGGFILFPSKKEGKSNVIMIITLGNEKLWPVIRTITKDSLFNLRVTVTPKK